MKNVSSFGIRRALVACVFVLVAPLASAIEPGIGFSHNDWTIACDNTRTCRAAGYQSDEAGAPISVLLTRHAGAGAPVRADIALGDYHGEASPERLSMHIDGHDLGPVNLEWSEGGEGVLTTSQFDALLRALRGVSEIRFVGDGPEQYWELSGRGAVAVLLKMDEFQGRLETPGALVRVGTRSEAGVPSALPTPVLRIAPLTPTRAEDVALVGSRALSDEILQSIDEDECFGVTPEDFRKSLDIERLSEAKLLVSGRCWMGAYNEGTGFWVANDTAPYQPELVTGAGSDYSDGIITGAQKGRGLGDCWWSASWIWDGERFVHASETTSGLCRLVAAGGPWDLPTLVSDVVPGR